MSAFVVGFVPGVTPRRWFRTWAERETATPLDGLRLEDHDQWDALFSGRVRMVFVRLAPGEQRPGGVHLIPLYDEQPVAVVPADHFVTAGTEVTHADIADELAELPESMPWVDRIAVVAGGAGLVVVPQAVAREFHRKDLAWRPVVDVPVTSVGLAWSREAPGDVPDPLVETFIGIVRGRTSRSSRGRDEPAPVPSARATPTGRRTAPTGRPDVRRGRRR